MDDEIDGALLANAEAAAARWKNRTRIREARTDALIRHEILAADSPDRLAARLNNIISDVRKSGGGMLPPESSILRKFVERPLPVTVAELSDQIVNEVIIGARDFLSVEFLDRGSAAARSVGRVLIRANGTLSARGTGFLVGPGLLLTNEHVLTSAELADRCVVQMDYEQNRFGLVKQPQEFALEPKRFFLNDHKLDYALVAVSVKSIQGVEISTYGWLPLNGAQGKIAISDEDHINIVQHPGGREKQVVIRNNRVLDMRTAAEGLGPFLHYEADTEKGSSGSPVMNDGWEVVGLHHSGVPAIDSQGNWLRKDDRIWDKEQHSVAEIKWVANEAVRTSSLVAAIEIAPLEKEKRAYLNEAMSATASMETFAPSLVPESVAHELEDTPVVRDVSSGRGSGPNREISKDKWEPSATIEVPLKITLSLGRAGNRSASAPMPRPRFRPSCSKRN
ncbi:trypsin-like serine peptidase [Mesorhizobium huakuii]|uniref:Trypsin-like peptidase domain-containing protein n=1 Tax=Mesorhizobium huakuii TaxID=28104 RepID=A0A7G6T4T7_9HYPH|nr:serine protease [Mesorhizobium huakuii]QND61769.1 trypsin-like peptidase domain-containing protein [Mesorhizobium huakuii]